jgi:hypothetical protein
MNSRRDWQRDTALRHRERKHDEALADGAAISDHALDVLAGAYVGVPAEHVKAWRMGRG